MRKDCSALDSHEPRAKQSAMRVSKIRYVNITIMLSLAIFSKMPQVSPDRSRSKDNNHELYEVCRTSLLVSLLRFAEPLLSSYFLPCWPLIHQLGFDCAGQEHEVCQTSLQVFLLLAACQAFFMAFCSLRVARPLFNSSHVLPKSSFVRQWEFACAVLLPRKW